MNASHEPGHLDCPNCRTPMQRHAFESLDANALEIDVCHHCHALWFDAHESARLSADGVVDLFRLVHAEGSATSERLNARLGCPRCRTALVFSNDIARHNKFSYYRCPKGHGRLTSFLHFLREKQFVRDLSLEERRKLAAHVRQIKCTSCGGPIDIASHSACTYCGAHVSVLDKEATQKALDHYLRERQRQGARVPASSPAPMTRERDDGLNYLWFELGTDLVGAFARMAARPSAGWTGAGLGAATPALADAATSVAGAALPTLGDALSSAGMSDAMSLVDSVRNFGGVSETLASGLGDSLAGGAGSVLDSAGELVADSSLVDLVTDGIGSIVEGLFS